MTLTDTWFDLTARANFEKHLETKGNKALQLGCFTGDATVWLVDNGYHVTDIDAFCGSDEHAGIDMEEVRKVYLDRTDGMPVQTLVGTTFQWLLELWRRNETFAFIYIDADHHAASVLSDAVMAWPLLASGGLMAFDDFQWGSELSRFDRPHTGINAFILAYGNQFDVLESNAQLWVRKR